MENIKDFYYRFLRYFQAKDNATATTYDKYLALCYAVRSQMIDFWIDTQKRYHDSNPRRVYYISLEYILGKSLRHNIINLNIENNVSDTARDLGFSLEELYEKDDDFELGNGARGRLAACMIESLATQGIASHSYGLRYDFAQYHQIIENGMQVERPCDWLHKGHPWEIIRPEYAGSVQYGGKSVPLNGDGFSKPCNWLSTEKVVAIPYDLPVCGFQNNMVNTLRLWSARATEEFLPDYLNHGDYTRACEENTQSGRITKLLYPEEDVRRTIEGRLKQCYFLVSASLNDIVRRFKLYNSDMTDLPKKAIIHLNGSSCALAIPEMMRILIDEERLPFEAAWETTRKLFSYTSYAVGKEDPELWPVYMVTQIFPRHMQLIFEINQFHLDRTRRWVGDNEMIRDLSVIQEGEVKRIRMGTLAAIGSVAVSGVSYEQSDLLKSRVFPELVRSNTTAFSRKSVGISHRRWLLNINRPLASLITEAIGDGWTRDAQKLEDLGKFIVRDDFCNRFWDIKHAAKRRFANYLKQSLGIEINPTDLFNVQATRIRQSKRQALHVLGILARYLELKTSERVIVKQTHIFGGKAAPTDHLGKQMIHLVHLVADIINNDPDTRGKLRVVFIPDYGMSWAERLIPAADLSEHLSVPGIEAVGSGCIKFGLNGALSIVSRSAISLEYIERMGEANTFAFGVTQEQLPHPNSYQPFDIIYKSEELKRIFKFIESKVDEIPGGSAIFPLLGTLRDSDSGYVMLDYADYMGRKNAAEALFGERIAWARKSLQNIAAMGCFSIDRLVAEYNKEIWNV